MTHQINARERREIATFLPAAISRAVNSYRSFSGQNASEKPKEFGEHHKACRAALSHIELLLKLAEYENLENIDDNGLLRTSLSEARQEYDGAKEIIGIEKDFLD